MPVRTLPELYAEIAASHPVQPDWVPERSARLYALMIDGVPLGEVPIEYQVPSATAGIYAKSFGEKVALGHVLVAAGLDERIEGIETNKPPLPDFRLMLRNGVIVDAEVGRIVSRTSAELTGGIESLGNALLPLESDGTVWPSATHGSMRLVLDFTSPPRGNREVARVADEIRNFIGTVTADEFELMRWYEAGADFPALHALKVELSAQRRENGQSLLQIRRDPLLWEKVAREETIESFSEVLDKKRRKRYETPNAKWLIMPIGEAIFMKSLVMNALREVVLAAAIAPFSLLAVGSFDDAIVVGPD